MRFLWVLLRESAMIELIETNRAEIERLCRRFHVKKLELFGSAADGTFDAAQSDVDFLLEFLPEAACRLFHGYFDFKDELQRLLGRKVDLVMPAAVRNPYLLRSINSQRRVLYAA